MISIKSDRELDQMRAAGYTVAEILDEVARLVKPGVSTGELDSVAEAMCRRLGVTPAFKGYHGFPASICISINDEVIHGIPSPIRTLKEGDIVGLDFGISRNGWYGDSARTVPVGKVSHSTLKLLDTTRHSLYLGIEECFEGNPISNIGHAIQSYAEKHGYGVVRDFAGHGIGRALHEEPQILNYGLKDRGIPLKVGMVLAIEPMINAGSPKIRVLEDGWTVVTADRSLSAHFEHTVAITANGPEILTVAY